jgi:uncharacterized membrane protein
MSREPNINAPSRTNNEKEKAIEKELFLCLLPFFGWGGYGIYILFPFLGFWAVPLGFLGGFLIGCLVACFISEFSNRPVELAIGGAIGLIVAICLVPTFMQAKKKADYRRIHSQQTRSLHPNP